jgi:hypothetical protein
VGEIVALRPNRHKDLVSDPVVTVIQVKTIHGRFRAMRTGDVEQEKVGEKDVQAVVEKSALISTSSYDMRLGEGDTAK